MFTPPYNPAPVGHSHGGRRSPKWRVTATKPRGRDWAPRTRCDWDLGVERLGPSALDAPVNEGRWNLAHVRPWAVTCREQRTHRGHEADQLHREVHSTNTSHPRPPDRLSAWWSGPVLLLLHGIAGSSLTWIPAMRLLDSDYTVLAPDFLGHGASEKPLGDYSLGNLATVMRDLLSLLGIDRATVVGQSFGGGVAMQFAYQFPERCERLVLVDAGGLGREVNWILRLATLPGTEYVMPALFPAFVGNWGDWSSSSSGRSSPNAEAVEMWRSYKSLTEGGSRGAFVRTIRSVIDPGGQSVSAADRLYLTRTCPRSSFGVTTTGSFRSTMPTSPTRPSPTAGWR